MKTKILIGYRFGRLTVIKRVENNKSGSAQWLCECECGNECVATTSILNSGHKKSCGCGYLHDLTGQRFGMLTVVKRINSPDGCKKVLWLCQCDCGNTTESSTSNLKSGKSESCGCVRTKHNGKGTRFYRIWSGMKDRCHNPKSKYWSRYGGRGIKVFAEWRNDFSAFRDWALGNGYQKDLTIDRIDNDKGYSPSNCQWITREENAQKGSRVFVRV